MSERLVESLLKRVNIKSVYYYNSNFIEAGRVDNKFLPEWSKFVTGKNVFSLVVNNALLGDPIYGVVKKLFINFTLFDRDDDADIFTLIYKEGDEIDAKTFLTHIVEHKTTFVNMEKLNNTPIECITYPFPHVIIDDFIESDKLPKILSEVNKLRDVDTKTKYIDPSSPYEFNKYAFNSNYGLYLKRIFVELNSPDFIKHIQLITGTDNIICNDISLYGSGIHRVKSYGFSQLHTDFNTYHSKNRVLDRRVNLFIYLNPDWKAEYKGELCLCDKNTNMCAKKIEPILNRCVIFNTTSSSIYGHPEPLNVPDDDDMLHYIAVNYYTQRGDDNNSDVDFEGAAPRNTKWYPDIDVSSPMSM